MWSGKLCAEAETSGSVAFLTLTYAVEPANFEYRDVQLMLKRFRKELWAKRQTRVRFFCVGERGDLNGRIHWHILLFFDKPTELARPKPGKRWRFWLEGWTQVQNLQADALRVKKIRYVVMYAVKGLGDRHKDLPRPRFSVSSLGEPHALGGEYLANLAAGSAYAGIVPDGTFTIPGVVFEKGHKAGTFQRFPLAGANRREFIKVWRAAWVDRYPGRPIPVNDWLLAFDKDACDENFWRNVGKKPLEWNGKGERLAVGQSIDRQTTVEWYVVAGGESVRVCVVEQTGVGSVVWGDDGHRYFDRSVGEVLGAAPDVIAKLDEWVRDVRGPNWVRASYAQTKAAERLKPPVCVNKGEFAEWEAANFVAFHAQADADRARQRPPRIEDIASRYISEGYVARVPQGACPF